MHVLVVKKNLFIILVAVLLCVNVAQCLVMLRNNRILRQAEYAAEQNNQSYYTALQTSQKLWDGFVKLDAVCVRNGLRELRLEQEVLSGKKMVIFIAPYVCGACVDEQNDVLTDLLAADYSDLPVLILTPQFMAKDLRAIYSPYSSVCVQTYDYDLLQEQALRDVSDVLFFASTEDGIRHIALSVKNMPEMTTDYISYLKTQCL